MDLSEFKPSPSEAHPETMDFLSREWCNFAVRTLQPAVRHKLRDTSIILLDNSIKKFEADVTCASFPKKMDKTGRMDDADFKSAIPPWKTNDVKSWIWMQQAMHPELNYSRKKWFPWKISPPKSKSIKKWWKELKAKRKEEERLERAQVHAAVSVAGLAAALAAIAAENSERVGGGTEDRTVRETAVASAAALVAAQCATAAEAMGAKRDQLSSVIGSAMSGTTASDILTLTAAATTSLRGAATLRARTGCKMNRLNGGVPVLPLENNSDFNLEFEKNRSILAKGTQIGVETPDGESKVRLVSIILSGDGKVILKLRKLNLLRSKKQFAILDLHVELYKDPESDKIDATCYLLVLRTNAGTVKLDMANDYERYKTWVATINHMLMLTS